MAVHTTHKPKPQVKTESSFPPPFRTSKSGKKMTVQYGTSWYEAHDVTLYTPLKVLTDLIPEGAEGHVRHRDGIRLLRRLMKHPGFGPCAQIALMVKIGSGAEREGVTFLLTKKQYLWMASALSDEYLALAIKAQYDNLSESERALKSADFVHLIKDDTLRLWNTEANNLTLEVIDAKQTTLEQLDALIADMGDIESVKADFATMANEAEKLVKAFQLNNPDTAVPEDNMSDALDRLGSAVAYRDVIKALLNEQIVPSEKAAEVVLDIRTKIAYAKVLHECISILDPLITDPVMRGRYTLSNNAIIRIHTVDVWVTDSHKRRLTSALSLAKNTAPIIDDFVEFGLYMAAYDRMAHTEMQNTLDKAFQQNHNCSPKQTATAARSVNAMFPLPRLSRGLVIVVRPDSSCCSWQVFTAYQN